MKAFIAIWIASRLGVQARDLRRSLRDYQRREHARIAELEHRSRGLRIYAAWARGRNGAASLNHKDAHLLLPHVTGGSFRTPAKLAA